MSLHVAISPKLPALPAIEKGVQLLHRHIASTAFGRRRNADGFAILRANPKQDVIALHTLNHCFLGLWATSVMRSFLGGLLLEISDRHWNVFDRPGSTASFLAWLQLVNPFQGSVRVE